MNDPQPAFAPPGPCGRCGHHEGSHTDVDPRGHVRWAKCTECDCEGWQRPAAAEPFPWQKERIPVVEDRTGLTPETALDRALRDARIRSKKHYAVSGHSIEIHKGDKPVVVGRRTITAAVGKYDDEPRGGGAKERARRLKRMERTEQSGTATSSGE